MDKRKATKDEGAMTKNVDPPTLLPCPFCGAPARVAIAGIACSRDTKDDNGDQCHAMPWARDAESWNRRVIPVGVAEPPPPPAAPEPHGLAELLTAIRKLPIRLSDAEGHAVLRLIEVEDAIERALRRAAGQGGKS